MYEYDAEILRVIDGDTLVALIDVGFHIHIKSTLRLYGINTPEQRTKDLEEKEKGIAATDRVMDLLKQCNNKVRIKFGRCLAEVQLTVKDNIINLNRTLIAEGHAEDYFSKSREG